ncbi:MAG: hypothetical protein WBY24_05660, partial [Candidatus Acidiferrales bacterium]
MRRGANHEAAEKIERADKPTPRWLASTSVLALILFGAGVTSAQSSLHSTATPPANTAKPSPVSAAQKIAAQPPANGMSTGIKVHGHWIIEVHNPDGSLVTHREFENEIQIAGVATLASLLARTATPGSWAIGLGDAVSPPCTTSMGFVSFAVYYTGAASQGCFIGEPSGVYAVPCAAANGCSPNLAISTFNNGMVGIPPHPGPASGCQTAPAGADVLPCLPVGPDNLLGFELKGYAVAQQAGQVTLVETTLMGCGSAIAPGTCSTTTSPGVTSNQTFSAAAG